MKKVFMVLLIAVFAFSSTSLWAAAGGRAKAPEGPVTIVYGEA
jgi:L-asparagine transporter-like permease